MALTFSTGDAYYDMLNEYLFPGLRDSLDNFNELYYQHHGAPAHYTNKVCNFLNLELNNRVTGHRGFIDWPPRNPDLICTDFYFWRVVKDMVFARKPLNLTDLR